MLKKTFFAVLVVMLVAFGAGIAMANQNLTGAVPVAGTQIDGLNAGDSTVALPAGLITHVNPGGLGDVLLYGYYNVREGAQIFNVVNTSPVTAVKTRIRFREGRLSAEVLDFNICLSAGDRWTGLLVGDATGPAVLTSLDSDTVTAPAIPAGGVAFKYSPENPNGEYITADGTQEGYFEIIGTVALADPTPPTTDPWTATNCQAAQVTGFEVPNVLMGSTQIVPLDTLESYGYNATAIANCTIFGPIDAALTTTLPTLESCQDNTNRADAISYVLAKEAISAAYDNRADWGAETELVLTFPTMWTYAGFNIAGDLDFVAPDVFDNDGVGCPTEVIISGVLDHHHPDMQLTIEVWDDAENRPTSTVGFSPAPVAAVDTICNEVNVIGVGTSEIMNSALRADINLPAGFDIGWLNIGLDVEQLLGDPEPAYPELAPAAWSRGLPSLGYRLDSIADGLFPTMSPIHYETYVF